MKQEAEAKARTEAEAKARLDAEGRLREEAIVEAHAAADAPAGRSLDALEQPGDAFLERLRVGMR